MSIGSYENNPRARGKPIQMSRCQVGGEGFVRLMRGVYRDESQSALEEKKAIADIIYAYKNLGIKTSENEITRIAVNLILHDYLENGEQSVLDRVLRALNG